MDKLLRKIGETEFRKMTYGEQNIAFAQLCEEAKATIAAELANDIGSISPTRLDAAVRQYRPLTGVLLSPDGLAQLHHDLKRAAFDIVAEKMGYAESGYAFMKGFDDDKSENVVLVFEYPDTDTAQEWKAWEAGRAYAIDLGLE